MENSSSGLNARDVVYVLDIGTLDTAMVGRSSSNNGEIIIIFGKTKKMEYLSMTSNSSNIIGMIRKEGNDGMH